MGLERFSAFGVGLEVEGSEGSRRDRVAWMWEGGTDQGETGETLDGGGSGVFCFLFLSDPWRCFCSPRKGTPMEARAWEGLRKHR